MYPIILCLISAFWLSAKVLGTVFSENYVWHTINTEPGKKWREKDWLIDGAINRQTEYEKSA